VLNRIITVSVDRLPDLGVECTLLQRFGFISLQAIPDIQLGVDITPRFFS